MLTIRPRSGVELIDASIQFFRENFALLLTTTIAAFAPIALLEYMQAANPADAMLALSTRIVTWFFASIAQAATIVIVAARYMGNSITPADALRAVWKRIGTVLGVSFVYGLFVGLATLALIIPGIYVATKYFASMAAAMVEGQRMNKAMDRSATLTVESKLRILGIFFVVFLVYVVLAAVVAVGAESVATPPVAALVVRLLMALTNPIGFILVTLLYFDLRIRREGLDIDLMMAPAAVPGATAVAG